MEESYNYVFCLPRITSRQEVDRLLSELKSIYELSLEGFSTINRTSAYSLRDPLTKSMTRKVTYLIGKQGLLRSKVNHLLSTWRNKMKCPPLRVYVTRLSKEQVSTSSLSDE